MLAGVRIGDLAVIDRDFLKTTRKHSRKNSSIGVASVALDVCASDRHTVSIELVIFVIAPLSGPQNCEVAHELDCRDPLDHLET